MCQPLHVLSLHGFCRRQNLGRSTEMAWLPHCIHLYCPRLFTCVVFGWETKSSWGFIFVLKDMMVLFLIWLRKTGPSLFCVRFQDIKNEIKLWHVGWTCQHPSNLSSLPCPNSLNRHAGEPPLTLCLQAQDVVAPFAPRARASDARLT